MTPVNAVLWRVPSTVSSAHLNTLRIAGITGQGRYPHGIRLSERSSRVSGLSGSPNANNSNNSWIVNFNNGNDNNNNRNNNNHVRLVRSGA